MLKHPERWHCLQKKFTMEEENEMTIRARNINHRPYAKAGVVLSFLLPFGWLGTGLAKLFNHWYCSMAVLYVITGKKKRISPRRLSKWALKNAPVQMMDIPKGAKALEILYDNPKLREQYGKVGREKVLRQYTWKVVGPQWEALIARMQDE